MLPCEFTVTISPKATALELVLLPGWGFGPTVFEPVLRVGSGPRSSLRRTEIRSLAGPELLAQHWPDAFASQLPPACDLLGWSLGGQLAMEIAAKYPKRVRRLVLVATTPCFVRRRGWNAAMPRATFEDFVWRTAQDTKAALQFFAGLTARGDRNERVVLRKLRKALAEGGQPDALSLRAGLNFLRDTDSRKSAAAIRAPTLVIHGTRDRLVPVAAGGWLTARIPGARFVAMQGAAHAPFLSDRAAFAAVLDDFLAAA